MAEPKLDAQVHASLDVVLQEEWVEIQRRRAKMYEGCDDVDAKASCNGDIARIDQNLVGLAFSGGGIRSATFNLGVLQGMADLDLLKHVDYLSTVSGGGYIGGWYACWIKREGSFENVQQQLKDDRGEQARATRRVAGVVVNRDSQPEVRSVLDGEPEPISHLRSFSNYLTPRLGVLSGDTWALLACYLRNLTANLLVLVPAVLLILTLTRAGLPFFVDAQARADEPFHWFAGQPWLMLLLAPIAIVGSIAYWLLHENSPLVPDPRALAADARSSDTRKKHTLIYWNIVVAMLVVAFYASVHSGVIGAWERAAEAVDWHLEYWHPALLMVLLPTVNIVVLVMAAYVLTALLGWLVFDPQWREIIARATGFLVAIAALWCGYTLVVFFGPYVIKRLVLALQTAAVLGWIGTSLWGVVAGHRAPLNQGTRTKPRSFVTALAPLVFLVGLVSVLSLAVSAIVDDRPTAVVMVPPSNSNPAATASGTERAVDVTNEDGTGPMMVRSTPARRITWFVRENQERLVHDYLEGLRTVPWRRIALMTIVTAAMTLLFAMTVDVNVYSLSEMYRNRLVRCYLGASRPKWRSRGVPTGVKDPPRESHPITGMDAADDMPLACFTIGKAQTTHCDKVVRDGRPEWSHPYWGPYLLTNTAINLVSGDELAWQERMADSFLLSPLYCGTSDLSYARTQWFGSHIDRLTLGTAMAISGAAANPNMGYNSSPAMTALMTVFNARLGCWVANPRSPNAWRRGYPRLGVRYLTSELFGLTSGASNFVNLSDGGHFDNLGLYELVRRRCRFIIVSDAGADPEAKFQDLGMAIRKCRTDFGVEIEINLKELHSDKPNGQSRWHCAVGTIRYDMATDDATVGTLVYIRPSITGDEPSDVLEYRALHPNFPQESTVDQFFSESQFESYRALGRHVAKKVFDHAVITVRQEVKKNQTFQEHASSKTDHECLARANGKHRRVTDLLFAQMCADWNPPPQMKDSEFLSTVKDYLDFLHELEANPQLNRFRRELYPEVSVDNASTSDFDELHATSHMLQVMENAWLTLNLDTYHDHPLNTGWISVFERWSQSDLVRKYWPVLRGEYSQSFVRYCEQQLSLRATLEPVMPWTLADDAMLDKHLDVEFRLEWPEEKAAQRGLREFREGAAQLEAYLKDRQGRKVEGTTSTAPVHAAWKLEIGSAPMSDRGKQEFQPLQTICGMAMLVASNPKTHLPLGELEKFDKTPPAEYELMFWVRRGYRTLNVGTCLMEGVLQKVSDLFQSQGIKDFKVHVRHPRSVWQGAGGRISKQQWFNFFNKYGFRRSPNWNDSEAYELQTLTPAMLKAVLANFDAAPHEAGAK